MGHKGSEWVAADLPYGPLRSGRPRALGCLRPRVPRRGDAIPLARPGHSQREPLTLAGGVGGRGAYPLRFACNRATLQLLDLGQHLDVFGERIAQDQPGGSTLTILQVFQVPAIYSGPRPS